jgi:hypothetical protein
MLQICDDLGDLAIESLNSEEINQVVEAFFTVEALIGKEETRTPPR